VITSPETPVSVGFDERGSVPRLFSVGVAVAVIVVSFRW
jgi:hypothetical protein